MIKLLYQQDDFPIFQNRIYESKEKAINCPKGNIRIVENLETGLVYNDAFLSELMVYDGSYQNEQAVSAVFQKHLESVATIIGHFMGKQSLIEVGCGKGYFLEMLLSKGFDVTGFDPTYEGVNSRVKRQYFEPGVIEEAQGLILRHVLEHVQDPVVFLEKLKSANGGSGKIYIEVPCFDWICEHKACFDVFYEHVNYFRLADFSQMFGKVIESGKTFGGQYIYVIAELSSLRKPVRDENSRVNIPIDFTESISNYSDINNNKVVIWGGSSKGVIFALMRLRRGLSVHAVVDINPAKHGMYLPGTGLQVKPPEEVLSAINGESIIFVMNSNYFDEIKEMSQNRFNYIKINND